jgi:hypothetical protein
MAMLFPGSAAAHCDTMDGPVVKAAQRALATRNVTFVLIWVEPAAEAEVRDAFRRTLQVRTLNATARELADRYFFETVVRLHRGSEGEPFDGIKPSGYDVGPAVVAPRRQRSAAIIKPTENAKSQDGVRLPDGRANVSAPRRLTQKTGLDKRLE